MDLLVHMTGIYDSQKWEHKLEILKLNNSVNQHLEYLILDLIHAMSGVHYDTKIQSKNRL